MSEQIREQVSAFLDGELPNTETELLLKRLTRDGELRESFGRYALIGEALRGAGSHILTRGFAARVNLAIDGEPAQVPGHVHQARASRWWRPLAGVTVAAGVATGSNREVDRALTLVWPERQYRFYPAKERRRRRTS